MNLWQLLNSHNEYVFGLHLLFSFFDIICTRHDKYSVNTLERFFLDGEQDWDEIACVKHSPLCELWLYVMSAVSAVSVKWAQYVTAKCDRRVRGNIWLLPLQKSSTTSVCLRAG